jgi:hypothetical protein
MGRYFFRWSTLLALSLFAVFVFALPVQGTQISGTISSTLTITDDSELVGDVTCKVEGNACILMATPHIKLNLNGFTIKGTIAGCTESTSFDDGIDVINEDNVTILGPGLIQGFGGFGIFLDSDSKITVKGVTISDSCFSGIILVSTTDSDIEKNVSVRNSLGSEGAPCGGT